nr:retrovirus-related Pol polyprotein from transposon TNT 1-94 [Tanacetum cinerariifolium]
KQAQKKQQSLYDEKVLLEKHDPPIVHDSEEILQLAQESCEKMKQLNKEIKPANYTKINHLSGVFFPQTAMSREELYFLNNSKTANVSKSISIPNEDLSDDTTPSVARKFLNEVKSTIVTLQRVVKHKMTIETHNWSSSAHQELHKIVRDKNFPIVNQVDTRVQNFEIQFLKALELEIERLLKAVVSQDIMNIVQKESVVDTSNIQTELERTKKRFGNCIIKKENEYAKLWNDWYKKCDECKYDKISYDKAYKDMQQKIEQLTQLFKKVYDQKDNTHDTSENTKFTKQPIVENLPKVGETNALSKPVTSNSVSTPQESKGMFRMNPVKTSRDEKHVPNTVRASDKKKPITVSQPPVITKKDVNSDSNGLSSTGVDNTKTRRPQPRSNTKHDRVPSVSNSSRNANYAGCKDTFKSTSGGAQFLGEKLVSWSSKKQDCTVLSTAEAEYVSLSVCFTQVLWMRTQLTDYGFHFNKILIYCDSKSAIAISCNPVQHSRTKHIVVCYHFIKEHVEKGTIELYFVKMDYQLADIFTKALPADRFNYLVHRLGMRSLAPKELERLPKSQ